MIRYVDRTLIVHYHHARAVLMNERTCPSIGPFPDWDRYEKRRDDYEAATPDKPLLYVRGK